MVLSVAVLPLMATCPLPANAAQQATYNTCGHLTVPFAGVFSGKYGSPGLGTTLYNGTGFFTYCGWSKVDGRQVVYYLAPFTMTIKTARGNINLHVPPGSSTYQIDNGTGQFARVIAGSGHFSLHQSAHGTFTGYLNGSIVLA